LPHFWVGARLSFRLVLALVQFCSLVRVRNLRLVILVQDPVGVFHVDVLLAVPHQVIVVGEAACTHKIINKQAMAYYTDNQSRGYMGENIRSEYA
jgi:hypothetical protein